MCSKQLSTSSIVTLLNGKQKLLQLSKRNVIYISSTDTYYNIAIINYNNNSHYIVVKFENEHWFECDFNEILQLLDCVSVEDFKHYRNIF